MAKKEFRHKKDYYEKNPNKLPESLKDLKGHEFHAVSKKREEGNQNRTTLVELRPKHFTALLELGDSKANKVVLVAKARERAATVKFKINLRLLKIAKKATATAEAALEQSEATLKATVIQRDTALRRVKKLKKKSRQPTAEAKELEALKTTSERIRTVADARRLKIASLDKRWSDLKSKNTLDEINISEMKKLNDELVKILEIAQAKLSAKGIDLLKIPETSGFTTASLAVSRSNVKTIGSKPLHGSNGG